MEDEGLNIWMDWILYSISHPKPSYFWLSLQKIVEATLWAWMGLRKRAGNRRAVGRVQLLNG